uniref:Integrase catalytic domain-containing protein n=1 Tax=Tanacetum cinerariifolium TaxID=118510 RepID=A0A6L2NXC0_TANCI|nr:hypothetical protein [Tanacetum cinerariifolium]
MLNKENYVPWSSRLLWYAKSRPNGKLIHNSILNGPYVRKMIPEPGDANREITVTETFHLQTDDELSDKKLKQIKSDDQAIHTILLGLPEDIYAATKDLHTADYTQLYDFLKYNQKEVDELKAERIAKNQDPLALMANSNNPYVFLAPHQDQSSFNQNYLQQPMPNPKDIIDSTTAMNMALTLMAKAFKLNYSTPTNNNQRISSNPKNRQIAQPRMNMGQDRQMQMVGGNGGNQFRQYAGNPAGYNDVIGNQVIQNGVQNLRVQNVGNQNGLIGVQGNGNQNQIGNGNLVAAQEYDLMAAAADLDEIEKVNANCILMANLQQASSLGTQTDIAPVYDTDGLAEVHENCDDNEIFNMFTQEEQYTELLEPIPESHQVPQNDNGVISEDTSVEQEETLQLAQESRDKMKQMNKELKLANYTKINHLSWVFVSQTALSREELYFSNNSKMANVSKSFSIPNEDLSDDTTPSVARKFLNEDNKRGTSANTKFAKQSILRNLPTVGIDNTKTKRPQPRSNKKNDRVPSASTSSCNKNKGVEVEEHHRNLLLSKNKKHINSESHVDCSNGDNSCTSNATEPKIKRFPNSTSLLGRKKQKSISSTKASSKFEAEITSSSYGFVWTNENCQYQWEAVYFDSVGISHQMSSVRTPQQNGVVERRNRTLVEAARTILIFSRTPLFLWAEVIATACFTQNRSIIHRRFNKTPYELINGRKPNISFLHVFGALCYPKNDREDIRKLGAKGDIGFFIGLKPGLQSMTSGQISSELDLTYAPSTIKKQQPTEGELDLLFEALYDDYFGGQPSGTLGNVPPAQEPQVRQTSTASTTLADTVPIPTNSSSHATNIPITSQDVDELNPNAMVDGNTAGGIYPGTLPLDRVEVLGLTISSDSDVTLKA